jgi:hypothetical protein
MPTVVYIKNQPAGYVNTLGMGAANIASYMIYSVRGGVDVFSEFSENQKPM